MYYFLFPDAKLLVMFHTDKLFRMFLNNTGILFVCVMSVAYVLDDVFLLHSCRQFLQTCDGAVQTAGPSAQTCGRNAVYRLYEVVL